MNTTFIIGNIVRDAELKNVNVENTPTPRCRFTVAVNENSRNGNQTVTYFECAAWRDYATKIAPWLTKGRQVHVQGRVGINKYTDAAGVVKANLQLSDVNVTFLGKKPEETVRQEPRVAAPEIVQEPDDLPF